MTETIAVRPGNGACTLGTTILDPTTTKGTADCFTEEFFLLMAPDWRDLPEYQPARGRSTIAVLGGVGFPSLREVVASHAKLDIPSDDRELLQVIKQRGMTLSLPQVEEMVYLILRSRVTGISEQWECLFFTEDKYNSVVVGFLSAYEERRRGRHRVKWVPGIYNVGMPANMRLPLGGHECLLVRSE